MLHRGANILLILQPLVDSPVGRRENDLVRPGDPKRRDKTELLFRAQREISAAVSIAMNKGFTCITDSSFHCKLCKRVCAGGCFNGPLQVKWLIKGATVDHRM